MRRPSGIFLGTVAGMLASVLEPSNYIFSAADLFCCLALGAVLGAILGAVADWEPKPAG